MVQSPASGDMFRHDNPAAYCATRVRCMSRDRGGTPHASSEPFLKRERFACTCSATRSAASDTRFERDGTRSRSPTHSRSSIAAAAWSSHRPSRSRRRSRRSHLALVGPDVSVRERRRGRDRRRRPRARQAIWATRRRSPRPRPSFPSRAMRRWKGKRCSSGTGRRTAARRRSSPRPAIRRRRSRIEDLGAVKLGVAAGESLALRRYSIDGVAWGREILYLDGERRFAAIVTRANLLPLEGVREDLAAATCGAAGLDCIRCRARRGRRGRANERVDSRDRRAQPSRSSVRESSPEPPPRRSTAAPC